MTSRLLPILVLLGFVALSLLCTCHHAPRIQAEVTANARQALEEGGFAPGLIAVDGRDAVLSGVVASDGDRGRMLDAVASARGVRRVADSLTRTGAAGPAGAAPTTAVSKPTPGAAGLEPGRGAAASRLDEPRSEDAGQPLAEALAALELERVEFGRDQDVLTAGSRTVLDQLARLLATRPGVRLRIVGHTDSRASAEHNADLSRRRAAAVRDYLVAAGLAAGRFETRGVGAEEPIADNATDEGRRRNRRVEFQLIGEAQ